MLSGFSAVDAFKMGGVIRDCNSSIPVTNLKITDHCIQGTYNLVFMGQSYQINATICPCTSSLCNAGNITFGGGEGANPPTTAPSTRDQPANKSSSKSQETLLSLIVAVFLAVINRGR